MQPLPDYRLYQAQNRGNRVALSPTPADVTELAKQHTEAAVTALVEALRCPGERVDAARCLIAIGWGAPVQPLAIDTNGLVIEFRDGQQPVRANGEDADEGHVDRSVV